MADPTLPAAPEKKEAPATSLDAPKPGTQQLNKKPDVPIDPATTARLKQMLVEQRLAREKAQSGELGKPEEKAAPPQKPSPAPDPPAPSPSSWPTPPQSLLTKPAAPPPAAETPKSLFHKPGTQLQDALQPSPAPAATQPELAPALKPELVPQPTNGPAASSGIAQLNRPTGGTGLLKGNRVTGQLPTLPEVEKKPDTEKKPAVEKQSSTRKTGPMRAVPKERVAQEVWKVIFQGLAGKEIKEIGVEVKGLTVIGRLEAGSDAKADLDLTPFGAAQLGVSRQHLILFPTDEGPCMMDLNSTNGTWVNGLYLEPGRKYRVRTGDRVELGSLKALLRVMSPAEQKPSSPESAAPTVKKEEGKA